MPVTVTDWAGFEPWKPKWTPVVFNESTKISHHVNIVDQLPVILRSMERKFERTDLFHVWGSCKRRWRSSVEIALR